MEVPKGFKGEIHAYYCVKHEYLCFMPKQAREDPDYAHLGKVADVDVTFGDTTAAVVEAFDNKIKAVRAEMLQRIEILKGKRAEFLALEVQP